MPDHRWLDPRSPGRRWLIPGLLAAVCLSLGAVLAFALWPERRHAEDFAAATAAEGSVEVSPASLRPRVRPFDAYAQALGRPPLLPSRHAPPDRAGGGASSGPEAPAAFTLQGIMIGKGRRLALLQRADGSVVRVEIGEEIDGWICEEISGASIVLRRGAIRRELGLISSGEPPAPAGRAAAAHRTGRRA
jgi:hypothetical protein